MVYRRRSGDRFGRAQSLCRLPAHRAGDQAGHSGSFVLSDSKLKNVPIDLGDFEVFFMGGRIQF
jgi:hypothetical protein